LPASTYYRLALGLALFTVLFLVWAVGALGIIGDGGEPDRMYVGVVAVALIGFVIARFRARGMAMALVATAAAQAIVTVIAVVTGQQENPGASVREILMINAMYVVLWLSAAWLFQRSTEGPMAVRVGAAAD